MMFPRRSLKVIAGGLLCIGACFSAVARRLPQTDSSSVSVRTYGEAPGDGSLPSGPARTVLIPGPLRSFLRMAGMSQEISPEEVLPLLARNVFLYGYEGRRETEYLLLVNRYVRLARELQVLAGPDGAIHVAGCADALQLIHVLGYQFQQNCGQHTATLVTANPERAFLTIDSGFPLTGLEEALQKGIPFNYPFPATRVPVLFNEKDWTELSALNKKSGGNLIDTLLNDPNVDRLYLAMARSDQQTRLALMQASGLRRLLPLAGAFDKYGSQVRIRSGEVAVPGGAGAERGWEDLVGAKLNSPGEFVPRLLAADRGWMAAFFDALSRTSQTQQVHFTEGGRLKRLYEAYRSTASRTQASEGVFSNNAELLVLFTRVQWGPDGQALVPGNLEIWKEIFTRQTRSSPTGDWAKRTQHWDSPERLLEGLVASSNIATDSGPVQIYLMLSAINSSRSAETRLSDETARLLADRFNQFKTWYLTFAEFPALDDASITRFVNVADRINGISNAALRSNALGAFQAEIGLWQIFARQGQIPNNRLNPSWQNAVQPFTEISTSVQLFDAARSSLGQLLLATGESANLSQDQIVDLLAGPSQDSRDGRRVHQQLAGRISTVMNDQRLVSIDTLFGLYDGLTDMAHGAAVGDNLLRLAGDLREFEMPSPVFTQSERVSWSPLVYASRHAELQVRTDLTKVIQSSGSPAQLEAARGKLTPFLRDTLVGLNYAYYEPPGAQVLHNNPLFVRSHDFSTTSILGFDQVWGSPQLIGIGATAGGGAYLIGSLADLPHALAEMEEDFIAPENVQALIWREVVPDLMVGATLPRWWNINSNELHAVGLYQRCGEELLTTSAVNPQLREKVIGILSDRMTGLRLARAELALQNPEGAAELIPQMLPAETFYLAAQFRSRFPEQAPLWGQAGRELESLSSRDPQDTSPEHLAKEFGMPHPAMAQSNSSTLLNTEPFPFFGGYASRLFGESWESSNLYWARLADESGYSPVMLNVLAPELTRHMIANIFATNFDDSSALLRAMEQTGEDFRKGKIIVQAANMVTRQ
jgi:hypothetical protein